MGRLSRSWRWLPALLVTVALILPSLGGSGWLLPAAHADAMPMVSAHASHPGSRVADPAVGHHPAPAAHAKDAVDAADATHATQATQATGDLPTPCADGLCGLCLALASRPVPAVAGPVLPTWPAALPATPVGRLVGPETPPPIA